MIRHSFALGEPQELAQREAVGTAPFQAAFAVDAFAPPIRSMRKYRPGDSDGRPRITA